jgi:hypothetical protein
VGSFRCFEKDDWERGLPLLALGDDARLKGLAERDRAAPKDAGARRAVGNGWWDLAKGNPRQRVTFQEAAKGNIQQRACYWYGLALPEATDKARELAEKGVRFFNRDHSALAWGHLDISQATRMDGSLHLSKGGKSVTTLRSYSGPVEVTVLARTEQNNIRIFGGKGSCVLFNSERDPTLLRVRRPDGTDKEESGTPLKADIEPLRPNNWYLLTWRITEQDMTVEINGSEVFTDEHKNDLSQSFPVRLGTFDSDIEVLSLTVRPIRKAATEVPKLAGSP